MNSFEKWQVIVNSISTGILLMTFIGALYLGLKQNEINDRLRALQEEYVAIAVVPGKENKLNVLNVGKANLYLWGFDLPDNNQKLLKPRLITPQTLSETYYWIDPPHNFDPQKGKQEFEFKLYLTDESNNKWISEHGGEALPIKKYINKKEVNAFEIKIWSYKTYKSDWNF